jgi:aspartyl-tRNA(Asn)/glutamyl-tRNA(Gln) amidotransferase subunit A
MLSDTVLFSTIGELARGLRARKFTPLELTDAYLERLEQIGAKLNAVVTVTTDLAREEAKKATAEMAARHFRGPLHGIPYGAGDLLATKGIKTTWGSRAYAEQVPTEDAAVVRRLRAAGAILVAKLSLVELAGAAGYRYANASATGPALNPWNPGRWAGGASGGSGAAVAAGLVGFAIGSEAWGSLMTPASFCGISGLRPTYGLVSRHGAMKVAWSMDKLGPLARSAEDCGLVLAALAGPDSADAASSGKSFPLSPHAAPPRLMGKRIGIIREDLAKYGQPEVGQAFEKALEVLRAGGAKTTDTALPDFPYDSVASTIISAEAAAAFEDLTRTGRTAQLIDPEGKVGFYSGRVILAVDYLRSQRIRSRIQQEITTLFADFDVLIAPSVLSVAPPVEADLNEVFKGGGAIAAAGNLAGLPALSIPCGFGAEQLPAGLQIVGKPFDEGTVIEVGRAYQAKTAWHHQHPPTSPPATL